MIRRASADDVEIIANLGREFHEEAGWADIADYRSVDCAETLRRMVDAEGALLLVAEDNGEIVGMAGAVLFPLYFNAAHLTAQELFWWIKPGLRNGEGGRLLDAMENEVRARGCESMIMIALDRVNPDATGRLYRRRGYRASEHSWIRRL